MAQAYPTKQRDYLICALEILSAAVAGTWRLEKGVSPEMEAQPPATSTVKDAAESFAGTSVSPVAFADPAKSSTVSTTEAVALPRSAVFFQALPWHRILIQPESATEPAIANHPLASTLPESKCSAYFTALPWCSRPTGITEMAQARPASVESAMPEQRCTAYFNALPWTGTRLAKLSVATQNTQISRRSASFFTNLPWQNGGLLSAEALTVAIIGHDLASIADRATQTALQAAAKATTKPPLLSAQADQFFQTLPWQSTLDY